MVEQFVETLISAFSGIYTGTGFSWRKDKRSRHFRRGGKKTVEVCIEKDKEITRILQSAAKERNADLEAWESAFRVAALAAGAKVLEGPVNTIGSGP